MLCPKCRVEMLTLEFEQVEIDHCNKCGGIWLDSGEIELIGDRAGALRPGLLAALETSATGKKVRGRKRRCPVCGKRMSLLQPPQLAVQLDRCPHSHGLWFDRGEVRQLIEAAGAANDSPLIRFLSALDRQRKKQAAISPRIPEGNGGRQSAP